MLELTVRFVTARVVSKRRYTHECAIECIWIREEDLQRVVGLFDGISNNPVSSKLQQMAYH